jgi:multidrug resistance efflux pump
LLLVVTDNFVVATARLAELSGTKQHASFEAAEAKVRMLREEYERIKAKLDRHRAERHSSSTQ